MALLESEIWKVIKEEKLIPNNLVENEMKGKSKDSDSHFVVHTGSSMNPALGELDLLEIRPYRCRPVHVGDVVFFTPPGNSQPVVHRVTRMTHDGIRTRGDNNAVEDDWRLKPEDIIGRVTFIRRGKKRKRTAGGLAGRSVAFLNYWRQVIVQRASYLLGPIYRSPILSKFIRHLLPARLRPRIISFQKESQKSVHILIGRRVIGRYDARLRQWLIKRPFRPLLDEASFPDCPLES